MLSYERSFSIFNKRPKIITQAYQKWFLKVSFFHSRPMRDYQWKIGFLIFNLGLYANLLRKSQKLIKIEKKNHFFKNKKRILQFYNRFFLQKNRLFRFTRNRIYYCHKKLKIFWKIAFFRKKSGLSCKWLHDFSYHYHNLHVWTTKTIFNDFQKIGKTHFLRSAFFIFDF